MELTDAMRKKGEKRSAIETTEAITAVAATNKHNSKKQISHRIGLKQQQQQHERRFTQSND